MRQNGYAKVDVNLLVFDKAICDFQGIITIPITGSDHKVICRDTAPYTAWKSTEIFGEWIDGEIDPKTTADIYARLEGYIEC